MERLHQRMLGLRHRLLFTDEPDPGVLQGVFALLFVLDLTLRAVGGSPLELGSWPAAGLALTAVTCVLAVVVPWSRLPAWAVGLLPVLDLAALGMSRMDTSGGGAGILAVVPALWLGRQFGTRGALAAVLGATFLLALPSLLYIGVTGVNLSRAVLIPVVAGWAAFAISFAIERVRAGQDVIEHQRRVSDAIFDTVDVGLVLLDEHGRYQGVNRRHEDFMRLAFPEGHAGQAGQVGEVFDGEGVRPFPREEMPTHRASQGEEFSDIRMWVGSDPLTRRALSVSARRVEDDRGHFAGAALAYKDVTDFMRALRVKDEFVASVSHELRTPLTSISGYVHILLDRDDLPPEVVSQLEVVERNSQRLGRLVADLLHTAQAEEGPMHVVRRATDLAAVVRDCAEAGRPAADAAGLSLELDVPDTLVLNLDAARMAQVVDNLLSNAIKYSTPGGRVCVALHIDADRVELSVADQGIGIGAADRDRLFGKFFRTRQAEERSIQGVGLGLSIAKSIVESHGGRIEVESELGVGTEFRVRIPL
jgi:two-component system, OmpR family, phosphate regulon sensor histidine kinase PhoR